MIEAYGEQATLAVLALTLLALTLTLWSAIRMLDLNTRPQIECYLRPRPGKPNVFELAIANLGRGAAKNLEVELIDVDEVDFEDHSVLLTWRYKGPFALLGPEEYITTLFGMAPSLVGKDKSPLKPFGVKVSYRWTPFWYWRAIGVAEDQTLTVDAFRGIVPDWPKNEVAELLKKELPQITKAISTRPRPQLPINTGVPDSAALKRLEALMPDLFAAMRKDIEESPLQREFITMPQNAIYSGGGYKRILVYHYEVYDDLANKVGVLVNSGAVLDITYTNVDRYLMSEALVNYLGEYDAA